MEKVTFKAGEIIHKAGDTVKTIECLVGGKVEIKAESFSVYAKKGSILGFLEQSASPYSYDYIACDETTINVYPFNNFSDVDNLIDDKSDISNQIINSTASMIVSLSSKYRQLRKFSDKFYNCLSKSYQRYKELCSLHGIEIQSFPFIDSNLPFVPMNDIADWTNDYYDQLDIMSDEIKKAYFSTHSSLITAFIWEAASHANLFISLIAQTKEYLNNIIEQYFFSSQADLFDLFHNLFLKSRNDTELKIEIKESLNNLIDDFECIPYIPEAKINELKDTYSELLNMSRLDDNDSESFNDSEDISMEELISKYSVIDNSLDIILRYANTDDAEDERFRNLISSFKILKDKNSSADSVLQLKKDITKSFMDIYESALISSFEVKGTPTILKMFFYFGYMDEELIGKDNALMLYEMAERLSTKKGHCVYTIYDWFKGIYDGVIEPSKNEFDQDFASFLKNQRAGGYLTEEMETRYLSSNKEKLRFELHNFFRIAIKSCSGHPSVFCPVLSDHNVIKSLESMLVTADRVNKNWNIIKAIDYSLFYRPCVFQSTEYHIARETILLDLLPNVILMPVIGSKAILWQETNGVRRDSRGRIALPVLTDEDLLLIQIKLAAEFRWEMCKRIQGARWNDVSDKSLTSDYFDYLQFYRKNNDLSPDAKEKIKTQLTNNHNSFKNVFISDYIVYIKNEALGSPRLNKVVKAILFTYCPFSKPIREKLKSNPMYENMILRHEIKSEKSFKSLSAKYSKLTAGSMKLPAEIIDYIKFYTK